MVSFPHCKINLGLNVLRKRADGYHDLETALYPLPLKDVLEIIPTTRRDLAGQHDPKTKQDLAGQDDSGAKDDSVAERDPAAPFNFSISGLPIPGDADANLCIKAWHLLKKDFPDLPSVDGWLYKNIPMGAGLGGGSSDGAFMLRLLNEKFRLRLGREELIAYALRLGSDCPFFLYDQPCFATGRGEGLEPMAIDLSGYSIVLVYPGVHISTALAYSELRPAVPAIPLKEALAMPVERWRETLVNDFEEPVCRRHPELQKIKEQLYGCGAVYASMTGSGSAFYGLFRRGAQKSRQDRQPGPWEKAGDREHRLPDASQFPGYFFRIL